VPAFRPLDSRHFPKSGHPSHAAHGAMDYSTTGTRALNFDRFGRRARRQRRGGWRHNKTLLRTRCRYPTRALPTAVLAAC
jgi:hypothetical protein